MPATGQSANAIEFSFDSPRVSIPDEATLRAAAVEGGAREDTEQAAPAALESPAPAASETAKPAPAAESPATAAPSDQPASADELKTYTIKVDGRELVVTEKDLLEGHMRLKDYTQKTQRISEERRQYEAKLGEYQQQLDALDNFLRNRQAIDAYLQRAFGTAASAAPQAAAPLDPSQPVTAAQVAEIARYNADQARIASERLINERFSQAQQAAVEAKQAVEVAKVEHEINAHMSQLLDRYPVLKKFEDIEEQLIADAAKYGPKSVEEGKRRLVEAAERRVAIIRSISEDEKKASAAAAAKLRSTATEPPGGRAPAPQGGKKLSLNTNSRKDMLAAAEADVRAFLDAQN